MTEAQAPTLRPDMDILADLESLTVHYPPLNNDRFHLRYRVTNGEVVVAGHVKTAITYKFLMDSVTGISGVTAVNTDSLFVDEMIRLECGRVVPVGLSVYVEYGTVVLSGRLPRGTSAEEVVSRVALIPGVTQVVTSFHE